MRILIQRVSRASVHVGKETVGEIGYGLLAFVGIHKQDTDEEARWMAEKVAQIRIFDDGNGKMNRSLEDIQGNVLVVSQFTLYGELEKGNRPNFMGAAEPAKAEALYEQFLKHLKSIVGEARLARGRFRAKMRVQLVNDGPVTILLDREHPEKS